MTSTKKIFIIIFFLAAVFSSYGERLGLKGYQDFTIDFPEGFYVYDMTSDGKSIQLVSDEHPVNALLRIYNYGKYGSSRRCMDDSLSRLGIKASPVEVDWRNQKCSFAVLSGTFFNGEHKGYAMTFTLPYDKGSVFFMTWCSKDKAAGCDNIMASTMDSVCIDTGSYYEEGIFTKWKYPDRGQLVNIELNIDGKKIQTKLFENDDTINRYLVEREYQVLLTYSKSTKWKEAWQRYYRMIFKDTYKRLRIPAFDIYNALIPYCDDDTALAQKLLTWTQNMVYEREKTVSDFATANSILMGGGSDCDSRSMLLAILLTHMNQDTVIFISKEFSHAMAGFVSTHPGHSFTVDGKKYLMGETTGKGLTWGKISSDMDNQSKWITVQFP